MSGRQNVHLAQRTLGITYFLSAVLKADACVALTGIMRDIAAAAEDRAGACRL